MSASDQDGLPRDRASSGRPSAPSRGGRGGQARRWAVTLAGVALASVLGAGFVAAEGEREVLVYRTGRRVVVLKHQVKGELTMVTGEDGRVYSVKTSELDLDASAKATAALNAPKPTPTPTPKPKSVVEAAREERERRARLQRTPTPVTPETTPGLVGPGVGPTPPPITVTTGPVPTNVASLLTPSPTPPPVAAPEARTPPPLPTEEPAASPATGAASGAGGGLPGGTLVWAAAGAVLLLGGGAALMLKRRPARAPARPAASGPAASEDLFEPAFATSAEDSAEATADAVQPGYGAPAPVSAQPEMLRLPSPSVLPEATELRIRIGADVYTCPDLETLKRWVEEGRVLENSEILSPEGSWLLAGTIPDLEASFEVKNRTMG